MGHSSRRFHSNGRHNETGDIDRRVLSGQSLITEDYMAELFSSTYPTNLPTDVTRASSMQTPFEPSRQAPMMSPHLDQSLFGHNSPIAAPSRRPTVQPGHVVNYPTSRPRPILELNHLQGPENLSPQANPPDQMALTEHEYISVTSSGSYPSFAAFAANELHSSESASHGHRQRGRSTRYALYPSPSPVLSICSFPLSGNFPWAVSCLWHGCTSSRSFIRQGSLWRHIKDQHIAREYYQCPAPLCDKTFGMSRRDRLRDHLLLAHGVRMDS